MDRLSLNINIDIYPFMDYSFMNSLYAERCVIIKKAAASFDCCGFAAGVIYLYARMVKLIESGDTACQAGHYFQDNFRGRA
jgi:hypothetical protein